MATSAPLHDAIHRKQLAGILSLLLNGADVNKQDDCGNAPIHIAAMCNEFESTMLLIEYGADIDKHNASGLTAAHIAAKEDNLECLKVLIHCGAKLGAKDKQGMTPFHHAMAANSKKAVEMLSANEGLLNEVDYYGRTPVYCAAERGSSDTLEFLLKTTNADIQTPAKNGWTPTFVTCINDHPHCLGILLERLGPMGARASDSHKRTCLHVAVEYRRIDCVRMLLRVIGCTGEDWNVQDNDGRRPIDITLENMDTGLLYFLLNCELIRKEHDSRKGLADGQYALKLDQSYRTMFGQTRVHIAVLLKEHKSLTIMNGSDEGLDHPDSKGKTPLHVAVEINYKEGVELLVEKANIQSQDCDGKTALFKALHNHAIVKLLLDHKADANIRTRESKMVPLHYAIQCEVDIEMVEDLICATSDLNVQDSDGKTPLYYAVERKDHPVIKKLLAKKADIRKYDKEGLTSLHIACRERDLRSVKLLIESSANLDILTSSMNTPLHCAMHAEEAKKSEFPVCNYLLEKIHEMEVNLNPLHVAAEIDAIHFVQHYQQSKPDIFDEEVKRSDSEGNNALHLASKRGHCEIVRKFLQCGLSCDKPNKRGQIPLHLSALNGMSDVLKVLLNKSGSVVNYCDKDKNTALHLAAENRHVDCIKTLIGEGADASAQNASKSTPLNHLLRNVSDGRHPDKILDGDIINLLLTKDCVGIADIRGLTPVMYAAKCQDAAAAIHPLLECMHSKNDPEAFEESVLKPVQQDILGKEMWQHLGDWYRAIVETGVDILDFLHKPGMIPPSERSFAFAPVAHINGPGEKHSATRKQKRIRDQAVIINYTWQGSKELGPRSGSEKDVKRLEKVFDQLGFHVHVKQDLKRQELLELIDRLCLDEKLDDAGAFIFVIMSHGTLDHILLPGEAHISVEDIKQPFIHCLKLTGKPKLFYIHSCREATSTPTFKSLMSQDIASSELALRCRVDEAGQNTEVEWYKDDILIAPCQDEREDHNLFDQCTEKYHMKKKQDEVSLSVKITGNGDQGTYTCRLVQIENGEKRTVAETREKIYVENEDGSGWSWMSEYEKFSTDETHPCSNVFTIYNTQPFEKATRNLDFGTWGIEEFALCCELYAHEEDLYGIFTKANKLLLLRERLYSAPLRQLMEFRGSPSKKWFFQPGY